MSPRPRRVTSAIATLLALVLAAVGVTILSLESGGVAIVETRTPDGGTRSTHVWFARHEGTLWLEAGAPGNPWFLDVQRSPRLFFSADGIAKAYEAVPVPDAAARSLVRSLLRRKYGWRDRWVGLFVDSSRSLAVRLDPVAVPAEAEAQ